MGRVPQKVGEVEALLKEARRPSTRVTLGWMQKLLLGNLDDVLREIAHQDFKRKPSAELLQHGKLGWKDEVQSKLHQEAEEAAKGRLAEQAPQPAVATPAGSLPDDADDLVALSAADIASGAVVASDATLATAVVASDAAPPTSLGEHTTPTADKLRAEYTQEASRSTCGSRCAPLLMAPPTTGCRQSRP